MKKHRCLLAALILGVGVSVSGWVSASVPMISLDQTRLAEVNADSRLASNNAVLGITDSAKSGVFSGVLKQVENMSTLTNHQVSAGSFSSYARQVSSSSSSSTSYLAPVADAGLLAAGQGGSVMVTSPSMPKTWAILLLAIGCVIYQGRQGRRRQRPFGVRVAD